MKFTSLAIRAMALSCTSASWESVKGSSSWEEKSCWCAREVAWHSMAQPGLLWGSAWDGACVLLAPHSNLLRAGRSLHPASAAASAAFHSLPTKKHPSASHPRTPRLWGDHLTGDLWWGLWDMAHGEAGGGKPQGWAPLARQAGPSGRQCWGGRAAGKAAEVAWAGAGEGALAGARRQGGGGGAWLVRRDIPCPPPCTRCWGWAPLKPGVTAHGDPVPRSDLQDVLQLHDAKGAGTAYQHLQHAVHRGQGL